MAIGWLTILQTVPWSEVISNAPKVADGAKKLWNAVAKKSTSPEVADSSPQAAASSESRTLIVLKARAVALEAEVADLHNQMLASTELIKTLADQNAHLIQRIETNRARVLWLSLATAVAIVSALLALFLEFSRHG